jgi:hypothetical protein
LPFDHSGSAPSREKPHYCPIEISRGTQSHDDWGPKQVCDRKDRADSERQIDENGTPLGWRFMAAERRRRRWLSVCGRSAQRSSLAKEIDN